MRKWWLVLATGIALLGMSPIHHHYLPTTGAGALAVGTPPPNPPFVQQIISGHATCAATNATSVLTNQPPANHLLLLYVVSNTTGTFTGPTGWTVRKAQVSNSFNFASWYLISNGSNGTSFTYADSIVNGTCDSWLVDLGNVNTTTPFDGAANTNASVLTGTTGPFTTNTVTATGANELGLAILNTGTAGQTVASRNPTTLNDYGDSGILSNHLMYQVVPAAGSFSAAMTMTATNSFAHQIESIDLINNSGASPSAPTMAGTLAWQAGNGAMDAYDVRAGSNQCGLPGGNTVNGGGTVSGATFSFLLAQSAGACSRNQVHPHCGANSECILTDGSTYGVQFTYRDSDINNLSPGMGLDCGQNTANCASTTTGCPGTGSTCPGDARALIWQVHPYVCSCTPVLTLNLVNGPNNLTTPQYWGIYDGGATGNQTLEWVEPYQPGQTKTWTIYWTNSSPGNCTAGSCTANGAVKVYDGGILVYSNSAVVTMCCATSSFGTNQYSWWNFGPYKWIWENTPNTSYMSTVNGTFDNMTFETCSGGVGTC